MADHGVFPRVQMETEYDEGNEGRFQGGIYKQYSCAAEHGRIGNKGATGKKLKREMEKLELEKVQLESRVKYLSDWIDDLESQRNECISGTCRMRKKIARLESAICLLEDKEWRAKRRAKKVRAVFQWQWREC